MMIIADFEAMVPDINSTVSEDGDKSNDAVPQDGVDEASWSGGTE